jgi:hypothetical protein
MENFSAVTTGAEDFDFLLGLPHMAHAVTGVNTETVIEGGQGTNAPSFL